MIFQSRHPRRFIVRIPLQNCVAAHNAVLHLVNPHQPTKLIRLVRFAFANNFGVRFEQTQHFVFHVGVAAPHPFLGLRDDFLNQRNEVSHLSDLGLSPQEFAHHFQSSLLQSLHHLAGLSHHAAGQSHQLLVTVPHALLIGRVEALGGTADLTRPNQQRMRDSYEKLVALTRSVVRQASEVMQRLEKGRLKVVGKLLRVQTQIAQLRHFVPLVEKVITQTKERVWGGNTHVENKVLSLFETHTEVIRKGKAQKPKKFGRLVRIDEVENGIVSGYQVLVGNPDDRTAWMPALEHHRTAFGRAPNMATADRGFFSAENEREAERMGVKKVALPARGRLSAKRAQRQKQRWFRRALRWRAGSEATISTLKHPFSMARATYKGERGFERYVGWCVITKNLFSIARYQERRRRDGSVG